MTDNAKSTSLIIKNTKLSRRRFLKKSLTGMALAGSATLPAWASMAEVSSGADEFSSQGKPKVTKASARYQDNPNKGRQCSGCVNFRSPSDCAIVEGPISPNGWCRHFKAKAVEKKGAPAKRS